MTFDPTSVEVLCVTLPKDHCVQVPWKYMKVCGYRDLFAKTWTKGHWPLDDLWPHICWGHMYDSTQGSLCPSPVGIHQCMWIQWSILQMTNQRSLTRRWPLTPHLLRSLCDSTQGSLCPSPMKIHQSMWIQWPFCKKLRSLTPRWPLTPHLLRSHGWLYPRIIVSKSHENTSKYVDTVTLFAKTWTKGHWPVDDLWTHICWGHMCDSTQGSLCPSPMGIHQCMWIQWSILQITTYILRTYYVQNQWSHSLSQARQQKLITVFQTLADLTELCIFICIQISIKNSHLLKILLTTLLNSTDDV